MLKTVEEHWCVNYVGLHSCWLGRHVDYRMLTAGWYDVIR